MKFLLLFAFGCITIRADQSTVLKEFSKGYTEFTAKVYKELLKSQSGNFLVCPISVDVILALSHNGARNQTAQQLAAGLNFPNDREKIRQIFWELTPHLKGNDKYNLTSANKIYLKQNFEILKEFKSTAVDIFDAEIQNIDFEQKQAAAVEMNKWVEDKTHDKIKDIISEDDLNKDTRAILINAMYFHGKWATQFKQNDTKKRDFRLNNEKKVQIDMMEITTSYKYHESSELDAKFLELPYEGDDITMTIVLPNNVEGLSTLEAKISDVLVSPPYSKEMVHVVLPKFKVESTIQFKPILQAFGVTDAFEGSADFSGMSTTPTSISKIVQKAFIEVEEEGTTAAAATVVIYEFRSALALPLPPVEFVADHPFIYYLKSPAGIMFIGRYIQN